jgi:hypothetical protein
MALALQREEAAEKYQALTRFLNFYQSSQMISKKRSPQSLSQSVIMWVVPKKPNSPCIESTERRKVRVEVMRSIRLANMVIYWKTLANQWVVGSRVRQQEG